MPPLRHLIKLNLTLCLHTIENIIIITLKKANSSRGRRLILQSVKSPGRVTVALRALGSTE